MSAHPNSPKPTIPLIAALPLFLGGTLVCGTAHGGNAAPDSWVPGRLLVQPKPGLPESELTKILKAHGARSIGKIDGINVHVVQLPPNLPEKAVAVLLAKNPHLKFAERDMIVKVDASADDPYFRSAWHLPKIGAPSAWDVASGDGTTIAILDTGVDGAHPDLVGKMVPGWNFYDNNADTTDVLGHGTKVAGAAAAMSNNQIGITGVATSAKIMPVRISDPTGYGSWSVIASALTWSADNGAKVANVSYSVSGSSTVQHAAQYMKGKGGLVVVSAGNTGTEVATAASKAMVSVSATDGGDVLAGWSSYGAYVDVSAPGVGIWVTTNGGGYATDSGTSFSSPITAGVAAMMFSANPGLSPDDVETLLEATAVDLGGAGWDKFYGFGRIDAAAAVQAAAGAANLDTQAPGVAITSPGNGVTVKSVVSIDVSATDNVGVTRVELAVNGTIVASDLAAPYGFSWDSRTVPDGSTNLTAYAYDAAGNYSANSVLISVANAVDTAPPVAELKNPTGGSTVTGNVAVAGVAADNVGVVGLALYIDGKKVSSSTTSSLSYNWNTRKVSSGSHILRLDAIDAAGNVGTQLVSVIK